jgi:nitroreductase
MNPPPLRQFTPAAALKAAEEFRQFMHERRTVRDFSSRPVPVELIQQCIHAAGSAPSGANLQPWHFVAVSDAAKKNQIRAAAEEEEREFYERRAPPEWLEALAPLGVHGSDKPFLETAPCLIAIFRKTIDHLPDGRAVKQYYSAESVGIATGILIAALHHCGLATLTHTPSPMAFLNEILDRPRHERPFLLLVVGYPIDNVQVPAISRKSLAEIMTHV